MESLVIEGVTYSQEQVLEIARIAELDLAAAQSTDSYWDSMFWHLVDGANEQYLKGQAAAWAAQGGHTLSVERFRLEYSVSELYALQYILFVNCHTPQLGVCEESHQIFDEIRFESHIALKETNPDRLNPDYFAWLRANKLKDRPRNFEYFERWQNACEVYHLRQQFPPEQIKKMPLKGPLAYPVQLDLSKFQVIAYTDAHHEIVTDSRLLDMVNHRERFYLIVLWNTHLSEEHQFYELIDGGEYV